MTPFLRKFLGTNWLLFGLMMALALFGLLAIHSVTYMHDDPDIAGFWRKQANWVALGTIGFFVASLVDYRWVKWGALPLYLVSIVFLVLTMFFGRKVYGARSWLQLGPINFQPAQLAVLAGILVLALFLSQFRNLPAILRLAISAILVAAPALMILKQPDLGETVVWGPVLFGMLFVGGIPLRYLIVIILLVVAAMPLAYNFGMKPHQRERITTFLDPEIDTQGAGWAINQSLIAVGSGGWDGKGYKAPNTQVELGFLPATAVHNDYIFAGVAEQGGFVVGVALIGAFGLLLVVCLAVAYRAADELGLLICVGMVGLMFFHIYQNIGMTIAIMPITGVPLPLVSYSGSFAVIIMFGLGLVNSIWVHRKALA